MEKVMRVGTVAAAEDRRASVFVKVRIEDGRASFTGVVGPLRNGDALGSCGQIREELLRTDLQLAPNWTGREVAELAHLWERWHLNDLRAGCEHQEKKKRNEGATFDVGAPCETCGYKYGHAWHTEKLPEDLADKIALFPDADRAPAWC